jgi:hypothetical protein
VNLAGLRAQRKAYLLRDLFTFCRDTGWIGPPYGLHEQPHREMCAEIEAAIPLLGTPGQRQEIFLAPRTTLKTSLLAAGMAYAALKYSDIRIAFGRGTHQLAKDILGEVKQKLKSPVILDVWGDIERDALIWNAEAVTFGNRERAYKEPTIQTFGLDVSLTGQHFDWIVGDDFVNETNYTSAKWMVKARVVTQGFFPIMESHGSLLLTGTRWGANDLYGWLMRQDDELEEAGEERTYRRYIRSCYDGPDGFFFPAVINEAFLKNMRGKTEPKLFSSWYLNQSYEEGAKLFSKFPNFDADYYAKPFPQLVYDEGDTTITVPLHVTMTIDGAMTTAMTLDTSDLMGVTVVGCDAEENWWVLHAEGFRKVPSEQSSHVLYLIRLYQPDIILLESAGADAKFVERLSLGIAELNESLGSSMALQSYSALRDEAKGKRGKFQRIEALEPLFYENRIRFRRGRCAELVRELDAWPDPVHDDVADALAMQHVVVRPATERYVESKRAFLELDEEAISWGPNGPPKKELPRPLAWVGRGSQYIA